MSALRRITAVLFAWMSIGNYAYAANDYSSYSIADELKKGCSAVVREYTTVFESPNIENATVKRTFVVTVLNAKGDGMADFREYTDKFRSLKNFSGELLDSRGNTIRKIKKSELKSTEAFNGLASDNTTYYFDLYAPSYPYTVKYEWEVTIKNGIICYPVFNPMRGSGCSVEKATYKLLLPKGTAFYYRNFNTDITPEKHTSANQDVYEWTLENVPMIEREVFGPSIETLCPTIFFSPHNFSYDGVPGVMKDWGSYAEWQWKLLDGRDILPSQLKAHIDNITAGADTPLEKVRILYDYLAATTRYVSIQIGIGGLQPMTVEEVYKYKFGDCKALSNYMRAMLAYCGIDSYYTVIGLGAQDVIADFANLLHTDHAILQVPLEQDTLWLECTAPSVVPFGYTHDGIAGRNAIVCKDGSSTIVRVNSYADSLNLSRTEAEVDLASDGSMTARVAKSYHMDRYMDNSDFIKLDNAQRMNRVSSGISIPTPHISSLACSEDKSVSPSLTLNYEMVARCIGSKTGDRILVNVSPFRKLYETKFSRSARKTKVEIKQGYWNDDTTVINLPEGFVAEVLPLPLSINCKYGKYNLKVEQTGEKLTITRSFLLRSGEYDTDQFEGFKSFILLVDKSDAAMIVLKGS